MARYNVDFQLSVEDMELIEDALRRSKSELASTMIEEGMPSPTEREKSQVADTSVRRIHDLLGRLHNQKVFYRPKNAPYVGG